MRFFNGLWEGSPVNLVVVANVKSNVILYQVVQMTILNTCGKQLQCLKKSLQ